MKNFSITHQDIVDERLPFGRGATVLNDRSSLQAAKARRDAFKAVEAGSATQAQVALVEETDAAVQSAIRGMPRGN